MTEPVPCNLELVRGDSFTGPIWRWLDADGEPVSLASARMQVRYRVDSTEPLISLTDADGLALDEPGEVQATFTPEQTAVLGRDGAVYDLEVTTDDDVVRTLVAGQISVLPDVTRDDGP